MSAQAVAAAGPPPPPASPSASFREGWWWLAATVVSRFYLSFAMALAAVAILPALGPWDSYVVRTGSMAPRINPGDVVVVSPLRRAEALPLGRVVSFIDPARVTPSGAAMLVIHRVVADRGNGTYTTAGDNNQSDDSAALRPAAVTGRGRLLVPWIGLPVVWASTGQYLPLLLWILLTIAAIVVVAITPRWPEDPDPPTDDDDAAEPPESRPDDANRGTDAAAETGLLGFPAQRDPAPVATPRGSVRAVFWQRRYPLIGALTLLVIVVGFASAGLQVASASFRAVAVNTGNSWTSVRITGYNNNVLADNPWAYFLLDETKGTSAADASPFGHTGTYGSSNVSYHQNGALTSTTSYAATFNGSQGRMVAGTAAASTAPTTYSLEVWFKTNTSQGGKIIGFENSTGQKGTVSDRYLFMRNDGKLTFGGWGSSPTLLTTPAAYNNNAWHHLVVTAAPKTGSTLQTAVIYVDGAQVATGDASAVSSYTGYWRIGFGLLPTGSSYPQSATFNATVDNAAFYTTALTATRVSAHYAAR